MSHNLFNQCFHFAYDGAAKMRMALKKIAIFMQHFAMSATPDLPVKNSICWSSGGSGHKNGYDRLFIIIIQ